MPWLNKPIQCYFCTTKSRDKNVLTIYFYESGRLFQNFRILSFSDLFGLFGKALISNEKSKISFFMYLYIHVYFLEKWKTWYIEIDNCEKQNLKFYYLKNFNSDPTYLEIQFFFFVKSTRIIFCIFVKQIL